MNALVQRFSGKALRHFHNDEGGAEAIESVVVLALAAVVVVGIYFLWNSAEVGGESGGISGGIAKVIGALFENAIGVIGKLV
jgi:Flp pilus assembly pilin Flp